ncbi:MAG: phosphotransferase [Proteobacteria bacterium]|nr:phosphotransferase [Pseudomonadota bacterium]
MDQRLSQLQVWVQQQFPKQSVDVKPLAGDASFRRYFRVRENGNSYVVMDAPPEKENSKPFVAIAEAFSKQGVLVPEIIAKDLNQGFLLLSDFGDQLYLDILNSDNADQLYQQAFNSLVKIQQCSLVEAWELPHFDAAFMQMELQRFDDWYLQKVLQLSPSASEQKLLAQVFKTIIENALAQPTVCVHRDYHSRNLLWLPDQTVGVLDFQDAVWGPITYDLVSLLRDCYITWPESKVREWVIKFYKQVVDAQITASGDEEQFLRWFDWMGVQRHIKVIGIFARLSERDGKHRYLDDIPRAFNYLMQVSQHYPELQSFSDWLQAKIIS